MVRSIFVPLDGSTFGENALPMALSIVRRSGGMLYLAHVHQTVPPATVAGVTVMDSVDLHLRQDEQAYLADVVRRIREKHAVEVTTALLDGDVVPALRDYVAAQKVQLVVMSTHGRGAMGRFWLGSVADDLLRELQVPVLLVRPHDGKPDLLRDPQLKSILLPLDGTALAEKVLEPTLALGQLFEAHYTLVRVIKPVVRPSYLPEGTTIQGISKNQLEQVHHLQTHLQDEARIYLDGVADRLRARGAQVATRVLIDEQPAIGILLEAQVRHADLIALQTHGRRGFKRLFLGSVADKLVRAGALPVLVNRTS